MAKGVAWLKANQRESGRWYTRSLNNDKAHYITNAGTAFAVFDGHRNADWTPYVYVTRDFGETWTSLRTEMTCIGMVDSTGGSGLPAGPSTV